MKKFLMTIAALYSSISIAGSASQGTLNTVHFMGNGVVLALTTGTRTGVPACANTQPTRFALDASTPAGKAQLAGLLTAYSSGKQVVIIGTGTCSSWGDTESIDYFYTSP